MADLKEINLEDLIAETEQKILNNEYYEDVDIEYKGGIIHTRIRPISQQNLLKLVRIKKHCKVQSLIHYLFIIVF